MANSPSGMWAEEVKLRLDRRDPYLRILCVNVFVRDVEQSLRFYLDRLGFTVTFDARYGPGERWVAVAPPDGLTILALSAPKPDAEEYRLIGHSRHVVFITENVPAIFAEWSERGVRFRHPPRTPPWGGTFTTFEDIDGNSFALVGRDEATQAIEAQRRALAEKQELERRAAQELEIAKQVQARLFPQRLPVYRTLDYAGICLQARAVGGDYYDFIDLGRNRVTMLVGDIAGKGIAAALLMASLHATLRSQPITSWNQPGWLLQSVNQFFYENTTDAAYLTLFLAEYIDELQRVRYVNCGHLPALLIRRNGDFERLHSTSTVLGLFNRWDCSTQERQLFPGDILAVYSDGATESFNDQGEEFGEWHLTEVLLRHRDLPAQALLVSILDEIRQFSRQEQHDDITLVVAKCQVAAADSWTPGDKGQGTR